MLRVFCANNEKLERENWRYVYTSIENIKKKLKKSSKTKYDGDYLYLKNYIILENDKIWMCAENCRAKLEVNIDEMDKCLDGFYETRDLPFYIFSFSNCMPNPKPPNSICKESKTVLREYSSYIYEEHRKGKASMLYYIYHPARINEDNEDEIVYGTSRGLTIRVPEIIQPPRDEFTAIKIADPSYQGSDYRKACLRDLRKNIKELDKVIIESLTVCD